MQATGILADGPVLRWATVRHSKKSYRILHLATRIQGDNVKQLYAASEKGTLVSGLAANDLMIHTQPLTSAPTRRMRDALLMQAQVQLHLPAEELLTVPLLDAKAEAATIYSTTKGALAAHLERWKQLDLDPERVSGLPAALRTFLRWKAPELSSCFLLDIGYSCCHCVWMEKGIVQKAHCCEMGLLGLKSAFQEDRKRLISLKEQEAIDFSSIKSGQYPLFAEEARKLRRELSKAFHSFHCQRPIVFTGELESHGFREFLFEGLRDVATEERRIGLSSEEQRYASCLGLAINYLSERKTPLQFRIGEGLSTKSWQTLGKMSAGLVACSLLFSTLFYAVGSWWMDKRETEIVSSLETWASARDANLRLELFSSKEDTEDLVNKWLKLVAKNSKDYPFLMKAPRALQFLEWLSHHPLIETFRAAGEPLSFEQIRYQLVSYPRIDALQEPYRVKVELEFKAKNPLNARRFHEMLLQGDKMVDASEEITWEAGADLYKSSFTLKNETNNNF